MRLFPRLIAEEAGEEWGDGYDLWRRRWHLRCSGMFWNVLEAAKGRRQLEPDELRQANDVLTHR